MAEKSGRRMPQTEAAQNNKIKARASWACQRQGAGGSGANSDAITYSTTDEPGPSHRRAAHNAKNNAIPQSDTHKAVLSPMLYMCRLYALLRQRLSVDEGAR